jgi:NTE family protein
VWPNAEAVAGIPGSIGGRQVIRIGMALSGGGIRAAVFHLGVLRRMAEARVLENISVLSTVSGGGLIVGLILSRNNLTWPSSEEFQERIYPELKSVLTTTNLLSLGVVLRNAQQWRHLPFNRARILANFLETKWGISGRLTDLPAKPFWVINTTSIESGKNWRFSRNFMGDWKFGTHFGPPFSISEALAASAAVPYVIGALKLKLPADGWQAIEPGTRNPTHEIAPHTRTVRLWDGGAYENLGLEPLYKPGGSAVGCDELIVSDASGAFPTIGDDRPARKAFPGNLFKSRLVQVASYQIRSLRCRQFVDAIKTGAVKGQLIQMGFPVQQLARYSGSDYAPDPETAFVSDENVEKARTYPTDLVHISEEMFEIIANHGSESAEAVYRYYRPDLTRD